MPLYASGRTVPKLDSASTIADDGLVIVHDGEELKKMTVSDFRSAMVTDVNAKIDSEVSRAQQAEQTNASNIETNASAIASNATILTNEISRAKEAEQANTSAISAEETRAKAVEETNAKAIASNASLISGNTSAIAAVNSRIPTVNNPTVSIKQGGTVKGSFGLNQTDDATIEVDGINNLVPYTGATSNVDLGEQGLTTAGIIRGQFVAAKGGSFSVLPTDDDTDNNGASHSVELNLENVMFPDGSQTEITHSSGIIDFSSIDTSGNSSGTKLAIGDPVDSNHAATKNYVDSMWTTAHTW